MAAKNFREIIDHPVPRIGIVDVGAMLTDEPERYRDLLEMGLATLVGFEPNPEELAKLQKRRGPYRYLPLFLGDGGPATFNLTRYAGCSSLLEPDPRIIDLFHTFSATHPGGNFRVTHSSPVRTTRLDDIGDEIDVHLLKLDVQGGELDVLRHGTAKLAHALVIECEVEFVPLYKGQPLFGDVQVFLREQGFVVHKLLDVGGRAFRPFTAPNPFIPVSQILWADAVFVRDFSRLERYTDEGLLRAAAILDVVYGSYDLAAYLLAEHDRRKATLLFERYATSLPDRALEFRPITIRGRKDTEIRDLPPD